MNARDLALLKAKLPLSASTLALNPVVGAVQNPQRPPVPKRSQSQNRGLESGESCVGYRVGIVSVRRRRTDDHDHLRSGARPLVDAITRTLGFRSDDDPRLHWEYCQMLTEGDEGTIVRITHLK